MAPSRRSKDAPSEVFPGFTDVDEVGSGSIATVYRARVHGTGRPVALKLITLPGVDPNLVVAAERKLAGLGSLTSHPNVVTLFQNFRLDDGRLVLVLELCRGSLRDQVDDGRGLPVADVVAAGVTIAKALDAVHRTGLLHLDISPGNILVTADGEPALADLGLAGLRPPGIPSLDGAVHTAPELLDRAAATPASDVYGLASSLYQLIAGHPAYATRAGESSAAMVLRVLREPAPQLTAAPPAVARLLARAMAKDPAARPATAAVFAAELETVLSAATPKQGTPDWSAPTLSQPEPPPQPPAEQTVRRSMLPPEFWTSGDKPSVAVDDIEAAALAEMEAAARADMAQAVADEKRESPPPAEATVRRSTLPRLPGPPPTADATVARGSLAGVLPAPPPGHPPAMAGPVALDPTALARRVTLRSGRARMLVDESGMTLRALLRKTPIAWSEISGFEARYDDPANPMTGGHLVAITRSGPVDLPATRRAMADLRYTQALLEAYRLRAQPASGY